MELNKIAAAVLLAGLIGMVTGKVATILYYGGDPHAGGDKEITRGYEIEGAEEYLSEMAAGAGKEKKEEKLASIIPLLHKADIQAGESFFAKKCALCHTHEKGGPHRTGPNQWEVVGQDIASKEGFNYSDALSDYPGEWTYDELNGFLHKPKKYIPGTIMAYIGIRDAEDRANVIAYLRTLSDSPEPIPEAPAEPEEPADAEGEAQEEPTADTMPADGTSDAPGAGETP